jgi:nuclear transport factor 2 (NTF2) superfamily protein
MTASRNACAFAIPVERTDENGTLVRRELINNHRHLTTGQRQFGWYAVGRARPLDHDEWLIAVKNLRNAT